MLILLEIEMPKPLNRIFFFVYAFHRIRSNRKKIGFKKICQSRSMQLPFQKCWRVRGFCLATSAHTHTHTHTQEMGTK